ncbi:hypothetical protein CSUI_005114, partial [Cystoisospora suis]
CIERWRKRSREMLSYVRAFSSLPRGFVSKEREDKCLLSLLSFLTS